MIGRLWGLLGLALAILLAVEITRAGAETPRTIHQAAAEEASRLRAKVEAWSLLHDDPHEPYSY